MKNLLIFISSQAPRSPTANTHPACSLHTTVQVEGSHRCSSIHPQKQRKGKAGWG